MQADRNIIPDYPAESIRSLINRRKYKANRNHRTNKQHEGVDEPFGKRGLGKPFGDISNTGDK